MIFCQYGCVLIPGPHSFSTLTYCGGGGGKRKRVSHLFCQLPRQRGSSVSEEVRPLARGDSVFAEINITRDALHSLLSACRPLCFSITSGHVVLSLPPGSTPDIGWENLSYCLRTPSRSRGTNQAAATNTLLTQVSHSFRPCPPPPSDQATSFISHSL